MNNTAISDQKSTEVNMTKPANKLQIKTSIKKTELDLLPCQLIIW